MNNYTASRVLDDIAFEYEDYAIGGKMIIASATIDHLDMRQMDEQKKEKVRMELATELAETILSSKLVEITTMLDPMSMRHVVKARCYLAPDSTVKLLRSIKK